MTDHDMNYLCAMAMGHTVRLSMLRGLAPRNPIELISGEIYDPLKDDAQAMALVKKFNFWIQPRNRLDGEWFVASNLDGFQEDCVNADLNRAIVECVAAMQQAAASNRTD